MIILKIVKSVFKKLCEKMESKELNLVWNCLYKEADECLNSGNIKHLRHILSVLVSAIKMQNGQKVSGKLKCFVTKLFLFVCSAKLNQLTMAMNYGSFIVS